MNLCFPNGDVIIPGTGGIKLKDGVIALVVLLKACLISNHSLFALA